MLAAAVARVGRSRTGPGGGERSSPPQRSGPSDGTRHRRRAATRAPAGEVVGVDRGAVQRVGLGSARVHPHAARRSAVPRNPSSLRSPVIVPAPTPTAVEEAAAPIGTKERSQRTAATSPGHRWWTGRCRGPVPCLPAVGHGRRDERRVRAGRLRRRTESLLAAHPQPAGRRPDPPAAASPGGRRSAWASRLQAALSDRRLTIRGSRGPSGGDHGGAALGRDRLGAGRPPRCREPGRFVGPGRPAAGCRAMAAGRAGPSGVRGPVDRSSGPRGRRSQGPGSRVHSDPAALAVEVDTRGRTWLKRS